MRLQVYALVIFALVFSLPIAHASLLNLTYDANGNLVTGDGFYREYNSLNQLWKVYNGSDTNLKLLEYTYDPIEERVLIKDEYWPNGSIRETTYYVSKTQVVVENASGQFEETYVYHNGQQVAQVDFEGNKEFILTDHLGSSTIITDENGTVIENSTYAPFGQLITGGSSRYDYEGKEQNEITGELDFNFRTYNPELALFTQPDFLIQNLYQPQFINRFSFEQNSPRNKIDPTGHVVIMIDGGPPYDRADPSNNILFNQIVNNLDSYIDVHRFDSSAEINDIESLLSTYSEDEPIVLIGYSWGGQKAISIANKLDKKDIVVDALITVDPTYGLVNSPYSTSNKGLNVNFYQTSLAFNAIRGYPKNNFINIVVTDSVNNVVDHIKIKQDKDLTGEITLIADQAHRKRYSAGLGAYISSSGKIYPTTNKNWKPPEDRTEN